LNLSKQIHRPQAYWQSSEETINSAFLYDIAAVTTTATKLTVLRLDVKDYSALFVLRLEVLLIRKPEGMTKQTCTHCKSDFSFKYIYKYALLP
jgi:hypothetical protein